MKADLHVHSHHSGDCELTARDIVDRCRSLGLRGVAIVDHNSLEGSTEALALGQKDVIILPGMEVTTKEGHVLAYNVTEEVPRDKGVEETINMIRRQGGIAVASHPFRIWSGLGKKGTKGRGFDGIEVVNGRSLSRANTRARRLALSERCGETGGSDSHFLSDIGKSYTIFPDDCSTAEDMVKAIAGKLTRAEGESRSFVASFSYGAKTISEWIGRGFRRL